MFMVSEEDLTSHPLKKVQHKLNFQEESMSYFVLAFLYCILTLAVVLNLVDCLA